MSHDRDTSYENSRVRQEGGEARSTSMDGKTVADDKAIDWISHL